MFEGYEPWFGELRTRNNGSLVADRSGPVTPFAMLNLQERGVLFVQPTTEVYEGMIVGENSRADDMDVNITKEKKLTNMRSSTADVTESIVPPLAPPLTPLTTSVVSASSPPSSCRSQTPRSDGIESKPQQCTIRAPLCCAFASQRSIESRTKSGSPVRSM